MVLVLVLVVEGVGSVGGWWATPNQLRGELDMTQATVLFLADRVHGAYARRLAEALAPDGLSLRRDDEPARSIDDLAERADALLASHQPDIACMACGPWSAPPPADLLPLATYERSLLRCAESLRRFCGRQVVYVTTPPVDAARFASASGAPDPDGAVVLNRAIAQHNQAAAALMAELNIPVADLHRELLRAGADAFAPGGIDLSDAGAALAAETVARGIRGLIRA
jgi:hypothetical protein